MRKLFETLFGVSIKRRVCEIIEEKIKVAQVAYNQELAYLKSRKDRDVQAVRQEADARVVGIEENFEDNVSGLANKHVREALSNLL